MRRQATKKPVTIDFFEISSLFLDHGLLKQWVESFGDTFEDKFELISWPFQIKVKTLEGTSYDVTEDDMVIRGPFGEYYTCKKNIFFETYDVLK